MVQNQKSTANQFIKGMFLEQTAPDYYVRHYPDMLVNMIYHEDEDLFEVQIEFINGFSCNHIDRVNIDIVNSKTGKYRCFLFNGGTRFYIINNFHGKITSKNCNGFDSDWREDTINTNWYLTFKKD